MLTIYRGNQSPKVMLHLGEGRQGQKKGGTSQTKAHQLASMERSERRGDLKAVGKIKKYRLLCNRS